MSASELRDLYEQLRQRATEGGPGRRDGLAVLHQQGLHAWLALVATAPPSSPRTEAPATLSMDPLTPAIDQSPLVHLCTDMFLTTLTSPIPKELR